MRAIEATRAFLFDRYRELFDPTFDFAVVYDTDRPSWFWVNEDLDPQDSAGANALLLDPEVGVALFLLGFRSQGEKQAGTNVRAQVARGVGLRSRLLPRRLPPSQGDARGSWRVVIHWFVEREGADSWRRQVSDLRRDTAHLDELPVDAIVSSDGDWSTAVRLHAFPRLLLRTRRVLRITSADALLEWASADAQVARAMEGFGTSFKGDLERKLAVDMEALSREGFTPPPPVRGQGVEPLQLTSLSVREFRNLRELDLDLGPMAVRSAVFHGPNGTGKSNLFEALELALGGTSQRAQDFLKDKDVTTTTKAREYQELYLRPIGRPGADPALRINGEQIPIAFGQVVVPSLVGTALSQDDTHRFVEMSARDLAAELLGGYSGLAEALLDTSGSESTKADAELKAMLTRLQLDRPGAIKSPETARAKVAERELREAGHAPADLLGRLRAVGWSWSATTALAPGLAEGLQPDGERLASLAKALSKPSLGDDAIKARLREFLTPLWTSRAEVDGFSSRLAAIRQPWPAKLGDQLTLWGTWLAERRADLSTEDPAALAALEVQRQELSKALSDLTRRGQLRKEREAHLAGIQSFVSGTWSRSGSAHCPTCDTDLAERGGALAVIAAVRTENAEALNALRKEYADVQQRQKDLEHRFALLGGSRCPLTDAEQDAVREALAVHLPEGSSLDQILSDPVERERCLAWIELVRAFPVSTPLAGDAEHFEAHIAAVTERLRSAYRDMELGFMRPEAWRSVAKELKSRLARVVERHLPETIAGLWRELVLNLTPAPWQIRGDLALTVESRRGSQEARIRLIGNADDEAARLARYILNRAEVRTLGLAWFLVQYLTHGRFKRALLVMDDPALDMDQTTFRDLCRLLESLLRLHRGRDMPLTVLLLLHQDERALDAARATDALLHRLVWNLGDASVARSVKLYNDEHRHPTPASILALTSTNSGQEMAAEGSTDAGRTR